MKASWHILEFEAGRLVAVEIDPATAAIESERGEVVMLTTNAGLATLARERGLPLMIRHPFSCELPSYYRQMGYPPLAPAAGWRGDVRQVALSA